MAKYLIIDSYENMDGDVVPDEPRKIVSSLDEECLLGCAVYELQEDGTFKKIKDFEDPVVKGFALWYIDSPHNAYNEPEYIKVCDFNFVENRNEFIKSEDFQKWYSKIGDIIFENDRNYLRTNTKQETKIAVARVISQKGAYGVTEPESNRYWCIGEYQDEHYNLESY